jgi:hypothetical protein
MLRSYHLLIVDNDIADRRLYRSLQKQAGSGACHIRQAVNGAAGLAELRAGTFPVSCSNRHHQKVAV